MKYAIFYPVDNKEGYDRHYFDYMSDSDTAEMLGKVDGVRIYNLELNTYCSKELCLCDLQEDYNDELLDGGYWMRIVDL